MVIVQTYRVQSWKATATECSLARKADKTAYEKAQSDAALKNRQEVAEKEKKWQESADKTQKAYNDNLKKAYASVAAYADGMRSKAATRTTSKPAVSETPQAPVGTNGAGSTALVLVPESDLYICATNTVKAEEWQDFWNGLN